MSENTTTAGTVTATDADADDSITGYAITGGADQALFSINTNTGALTFATAPNFEAPADANTDNAYAVEVTATSGTGTRERTATQAITVTVTDDETEAPSAPDTPTISAVTWTGFTVTWTAPENTGPAITGYNVRYRVSTSGPWTDAGHSGTALTLTLTGLTAETTYQVQVQATNAEGPGDWSAAATATTSAPPSVTVSESAVTVPEGRSAAYTIVLDTEPSAAVTVTVSASGDADLTASPATLEFTRSNWNDAQTVTVSASPDDDATNGEATVAHRATGGGYGPVSIASVTATEEDDDRVGSAEKAAVKHSMSGLARGMLSSAEMMMSSRFRRSEGYGPAREMRIGGESLSVRPSVGVAWEPVVVG